MEGFTEVTSTNLSVSTRNDFENSIMDKRVLFLFMGLYIISHYIVHGYKAVGTHQSLDHLNSLSTEVDYGACYIHHPFLLYLVQNTVNSDECSCSPYTSTVTNWIIIFSLCSIHIQTCSGRWLVPWISCGVSSLSCGRPEVMWHSQALHGQARQ